MRLWRCRRQSGFTTSRPQEILYPFSSDPPLIPRCPSRPPRARRTLSRYFPLRQSPSPQQPLRCVPSRALHPLPPSLRLLCPRPSLPSSPPSPRPRLLPLTSRVQLLSMHHAIPSLLIVGVLQVRSPKPDDFLPRARPSGGSARPPTPPSRPAPPSTWPVAHQLCKSNISEVPD